MWIVSNRDQGSCCCLLHAERALCVLFGVKGGDLHGSEREVTGGADWHSDAGME